MDLTIGELVVLGVVLWILSQIVLGVLDGIQIVTLTERIKHLNHLSDIIHQVKVEKIGEVEYWFDSDSEQFLAQGYTVDEIIDVVKSRFPEHIFLIKGQGGVAAQTDWKFLPTEEFQKVQINLKKGE